MKDVCANAGLLIRTAAIEVRLNFDRHLGIFEICEYIEVSILIGLKFADEVYEKPIIIDIKISKVV